MVRAERGPHNPPITNMAFRGKKQWKGGKSPTKIGGAGVMMVPSTRGPPGTPGPGAAVRRPGSSAAGSFPAAVVDDPAGEGPLSAERRGPRVPGLPGLPKSWVDLRKES